MNNAQAQFAGEVTQLFGVISGVAGMVLSLHYWPAAVFLIGGMAAFAVGKYLRSWRR